MVRPSRSQLGTGALVVAALALGQTLDDRLPDQTDATGLFERPVGIGDTVQMRTGRLTPTSVDGAVSVLRSVGSSIRSPGVVLVLEFDFVSRGKTSSIRYGELRDGTGRVTIFGPSAERNEVTCPGGPVGIVVHCTAVVEADPDTLAGATLGLAADELDPRFDDMALVDLDISTADVRAWQATEELEVDVYDVAGME
ncbi:MAG: hypothetical protein ABW004_16645 [Aeromicrobium sp.]